MERRRLDIPVLVLLALAVAVTAVMQTIYLFQLVLNHMPVGAGFFGGLDSRISSIDARGPGSLHFAFFALLQLAGMAGIGHALLARRTVSPLWLTASGIALVAVELDRFVLGFSLGDMGLSHSLRWLSLLRSHGTLFDTLQAAAGIVAVALLVLLVRRVLPRGWMSVLFVVLAASIFLQGWLVAADLRYLRVAPMMSVTFAADYAAFRTQAIALSAGVVLFNVALALLALRSGKNASPRTI
jgi:hypothetical protein